MKIALELLLILAAYLLGSIPFGYIFTKKYTGKNIRDYGSGNIGSICLKGFCPLQPFGLLAHTTCSIFMHSLFMPWRWQPFWGIISVFFCGLKVAKG